MSQDQIFNDDDAESDLRLLDDDGADIQRLKLPAPTEKPEDDVDERIARIEFHCSVCNMHELVHYYGKEPPFGLGIRFREDSFVMRDPFQAPPPRWQSKAEYYVALGVKCATCGKPVCKDAACSFYYTQTYCLPCGSVQLKSWPVEAQSKLRKQLAASKQKEQSN
ncbi:cysteine-rich DPF motif domain-containing protein 1 [Drosophila grimshawi]|uniref:Cysteine-rich DPF motif domain-containing protein 1 n=1 Tax=Drosophila grimshawi TaxID=7222 RepID=B4JSJ2_DROGR|nr:cysteine-rich DPF motif domain-containing protein 1 [Drosophila grimshawi]EDV94732.1 GH18008 [Drosophila grimshawi]